MKKKTLIVSTALLLVAIMCLATASYAWFTAGTTAKAQGMKITTRAGTSLLIKGESDSNYTDVGTSTKTGTLVPATSFDGKDFAKLGANVKVSNENSATATWSGQGGAFKDGDLVTATNSDDVKYFVTGNYILKNTGSEPVDVMVDSLTVSGSADIRPATRIAIKVGDVYKVFKPVTGTCTQVGQLNSTKWELATPVYADPDSTIIVDNLAAGGTQELSVIVWFEGQDSAASTVNAVSLASANLDISLDFETA